ncbi:MAG: HAD-IC family P-type ATPase [Clostridia bacterium]|nr:HAD-IC family P-type ATPase [Clostridia bacterium]
MLFLGVVIINTAISTIQEIHSKKVVDKLAVMASSKANVLRDGKEEEITVNEIVIDDVLILNTGNQIVTDCKIIEGTVEVNESAITGEPNSITKDINEKILSGSYIVSGKCLAKVIHVGEENYTAKIQSDAKYVKKVNSEIMNSLRKIIKFLTFAIIPMGALLFINQIRLPNIEFNEAVIKSVAGIIGMIPEGLVLLTSTVLAVSVIRLSKEKVLVQELYCIETLARVDTLCLDKTGTLTEGKMEVKDYISFENQKDNLKNILANIAKASEDENPTIMAVKEFFTEINKKFEVNCKVAFSSKNKWSGINFKDEGSFILGAPEFILKERYEEYKDRVEEYSKTYRVLLIAHSKFNFENKEIPKEINPLGIVIIQDKIRKEAKETLEYFKNNQVDIKIISGDNPVTVSQIAKQVGVEEYKNYIDMSKLKSIEDVKEAAEKYTIFGRVSPLQKKELVCSLQKQGRTVAMTGDGVNDVLALKQSDCAISMANGSDATKNVAELILLDSNFNSMPKVVKEGRRTINNIQRSASLFLAKTMYSTVLAFLFLFMGEKYPFLPIQLSLISEVTIGLPSFILALEPNNEKIKGNFLKNILKKAVPAAITAVLVVFSIAMAHKFENLPEEYYSSLCVVGLGMSGIVLLFDLARTRKEEKRKLPISIFRFIISGLMLILFFIGLTALKWWFNICDIEFIVPHIIKIIILALIDYTIISVIIRKIWKIKVD